MEVKLLTTTETTQMLRCSKKYVYVLIGDEDFPKVRIGKKYLIPGDELKKWVRSQCAVQSERKEKKA